MYQQLYKYKQIKLLGLISGAVILPMLSVKAPAFATPQQSTNLISQVPSTTSPSLNPRPSIFDEPPYSRSQRPAPPSPGGVTPIPLPEQQQPPSATVTPVNGRISIRLTNTTNAIAFYQVIGDTEQRTLAGKSQVTLQNLAIPTTLTFSRQDRGLLRTTTSATTAGLLEVTFDATTDLAEDRTTLRVQPDGTVFLN